jgi:MFS family permease
MRSLLSRTVLLLSLVSLLTDVSSELLYPVLPAYLQQVGFSVLAIGMLEGFANMIIGLSTGYFGAWSDKSGDRISFVRSGYLMSALGKPIIIFFSNPFWILFSRVIERLGKGVRTGARDAMLLNEAKSGSSGKVFGFHRAMDTLGAVIGPLLALCYLYFHPGDYRTLFLVAFIPALAGVFFTFQIKGNNLAVEKKQGAPYSVIRFFSFPFRTTGKVRRILLGVFIFSLFNSADVYLFLMLKLNGHTDLTALSAYIGYNLIYALAAMPFGGLSDRIGARTVFILGMFLFAAAYTGFALFHSNESVYISFLFYGLFSAATEGNVKAWLGNHIQSSDKALAFGYLKATSSVALLIASAFTGLLWQTFGAEVAFVFSALGALTAGLFMFIFAPKS